MKTFRFAFLSLLVVLVVGIEAAPLRVATYNIGGNNERTNLELVKTICSLMTDHHPVDEMAYEDLITFVADRPGHDRRYAINASKIEQDLNWTPSVKWNDGFAKTLEWYLSNESWWRPLVKKGAFGQRLGLKK